LLRAKRYADIHAGHISGKENIRDSAAGRKDGMWSWSLQGVWEVLYIKLYVKTDPHLI